MADYIQRVYLLKQAMIFSELRTDDLLQIANFLTEESFARGDKIFSINDRGNELYIIVSGRIGISLSDKPGNNISELGPGECFGEMNLLDEQPRSASAFVLEDSELLILSKMQFEHLLEQHAEIAKGMLKSLSLRLRKILKRD